MLDWANAQSGEGYARIVDPGAGSGRYVLRALQRFPGTLGVAVEKNEEVAALLSASARLLGLDSRLTVHVGDYREVELPPIDGRTLFIGNPPYVRHHDISGEWKRWYSLTLARLGCKGSQLAGLHLHFFVRTLELARAGDVGCFVTAAEWLDAGYGSPLRELLAGVMGGAFVDVVSSSVGVFEDAMVSAAITGFCPQTPRRELSFKELQSLDAESVQLPTMNVAATAAYAERKWTRFLRAAPERVVDDGLIELGELFRVHRGQVTGCNRVWVAGAEALDVPERFKLPCITDAKDIIRAGAELNDSSGLKRVLDLPRSLDELTDGEREAVEQFLAWATQEGAESSYIAQHRKPWWKVNLKAPAPIIMTYMGRRPPAFALNAAGAHLINIAHGLYPREPLPLEYLSRLVGWLNANVQRTAGRVYAGGLTKFEPSEVMRLRIPAPPQLLD